MNQHDKSPNLYCKTIIYIKILHVCFIEAAKLLGQFKFAKKSWTPHSLISHYILLTNWNTWQTRKQGFVPVHSGPNWLGRGVQSAALCQNTCRLTHMLASAVSPPGSPQTGKHTSTRLEVHLLAHTHTAHTHSRTSIFVRTFRSILHYPASYPNHPNEPRDPDLTPTLKHPVQVNIKVQERSHCHQKRSVWNHLHLWAAVTSISLPGSQASWMLR